MSASRVRRQRQRPPWRTLTAVTLAAALPLLTGCDVEWGGVQVKLQEPEYRREAPAEAAAEGQAERAPLELPSGVLAFHVSRLDAAGMAAIEPIAELRDGNLRPVGPQRAEEADEYSSAFIRGHYRAEQAYALYRGAGRVGTFYVRAPAIAGSGLCLELRALGQLELRPRADTLSEFLAWPPGVRAGDEGFRPPTYREDMLELSQVLVRRGVSDGAVAGDWRFGVPSDLRALDVGTGPLGFAATFMIGDSLAVGPPGSAAGSAFVVADYAPSRGYFPLYMDAAWYEPGRKRALRWVDAVDMLGDASAEWVVQAYGDAGSWFEVLVGRAGTVEVLWSGRRPVCEAREAQPGGR
ncbi:MAG: hypothetical protein JSU87_03630 [Gemmatimonadota bacterium]|nr:MAG: hypothetical protein JSU87_03630 [Gemmatimonadota bacterium]